MAILRSVDGKFYEIPDEELSQHEVPAEKVTAIMDAMGGGEPGGGPGGAGPGGAGPGGAGPEGLGPEGGGDDVEPYGYYRRRRYYWRNCWRNHWRNCY